MPCTSLSVYVPLTRAGKMPQVQNIGSAVWFIVCLMLPLTGNSTTGTVGSYTQVYIQVALLALGLACFIILDVISQRRSRTAISTAKPGASDN